MGDIFKVNWIIILKMYFRKEKSKLVTYSSGGFRSAIDFVMVSKWSGEGLSCDCWGGIRFAASGTWLQEEVDEQSVKAGQGRCEKCVNGG